MRWFDRFRNVEAWATAGLALWLSVSLLASFYELYSSAGDWLHVAGKLAGIGFLSLLLALVLQRPAPIAKAAGIWPRVSGVAAVALPACAGVFAGFGERFRRAGFCRNMRRYLCGVVAGAQFQRVCAGAHAGNIRAISACAPSAVSGRGLCRVWRAAGLSNAAGAAAVWRHHHQPVLADAV